MKNFNFQSFHVSQIAFFLQLVILISYLPSPRLTIYEIVCVIKPFTSRLIEHALCALKGFWNTYKRE